LLFIVAATAGCHLIDDDLSGCGVNTLINYELRLVTKVQMEIDEELSSDVDKPVADALKKWSAPFYSGNAHDLDMSFFSLAGTDELLEHKSDIINANQKSYTLYIPRKDYRHVAVVNIAQNNNVSLEGGEYASTIRVVQRTADTLDSHNTAVYTARLPMHMTDVDTNLTFNVHLYMVNCGVALVLSDDGSTIPTMRGMVLNGTATGFSINDSTFTYTKSTPIRAEKVMDRCYAVLSLPSPDAPSSAAGSRRVAASDDSALWDVQVYTDMPDGTVTETKLSFPYALQAGTLEIIKVQMQDDGSVVVVGNAEVGITVTLDWKEGDEHEVEL
jgi:hypothetical protein